MYARDVGPRETGLERHGMEVDQALVERHPDDPRLLEALLMLAAGDGATFAWDPSREQLSIEARNTDACRGIARALLLLNVCLAGPAVITMLDEAGWSWRYILVDDDVKMRPAGMNFDGPVLVQTLSVLAADAVSPYRLAECAT